MKILAIETSCDETAAAVVENGRCVHSSVVYSQIEEHKLYGGVVPEIASRRHTEQIIPVTRAALKQADISLEDVDAVAVTYAPGLIGALLVGVGYAKGLCISQKKPLIPVHHIRGHVAANYIDHPTLKPPFLCLIVSGGHSHIVEVLDYTTFRIVGRTRDDAAGEAFDKVARVLGLGYPGGVAMDKAGALGDNLMYKFPRPKVNGSPYDFSFSGLKTAVINTVHNLTQKNEEISVNDMAASFGFTVAEILTQRFFLAAKDLGYTNIACAGGVSANSVLRKALQDGANNYGYKLYMPSLALCGDNAAMIGAQAFYELKSGNLASMDLNAYASLKI